MRMKLKSEALKTEFAIQIKELRLNKMLVGRGARRHLIDISLVLLSTFLKIFEPSSAAAAATGRSSRNASSSSRHFESKY